MTSGPDPRRSDLERELLEADRYFDAARISLFYVLDDAVAGGLDLPGDVTLALDLARGARGRWLLALRSAARP